MAAKTQCTGYSSRDQDPNIPRSIVQHLEAEIAKIEGELARNGHLEELNASDILAGMPTHNGMPLENQGAPILDFNSLESPTQPPVSSVNGSSPAIINDMARNETMHCGEFQALMFSLLPRGPGMTDLIARVRMSLTPSSAVASGSPKEARRKSFSRISDEVSCNMLRSIPVNIVRNLMKKYMARVYPIFPVIYGPHLWESLENVLQTLQRLPERHRSVPPSFDFLVIYMILSASATLGSAKSGHEARHMFFSGSLFEEGIQHLSERANIPSDLAGIQALLLVLQYASINPRLANVWMLCGAIMRACLELGLHREPPNTMPMDCITLDLRRRVFWSAYCFDRSICSALQRPLSIPDQTIDARYPSTLDDRYIHANGIESSGQQTKLHMLRWVQFRRLQSTMTEVHFQGKSLEPGQSWQDWLDFMEGRLRAWYNDYNDGHELTDFTLNHGLTNLHRPSPRMPMPSPQSLLVAFEAACASAKNLREHISAGFYRRSWLIAHHVLENSMVVLFCLRNAFDTVMSKHNAQEVFEMTKVFTTDFLALAAQGWNEVSNYAGIFERLLGPLLESVFSNRPPSDSSFGPVQDAELARLLYPGPAQLDKLRFGSRSFHQDDLPPFDIGSLNWDDFSGSDGSVTAEFPGGREILDPFPFVNADPDMLVGMV